ncbi:hypothetical protein MESS4_750161 [Mesorhizobium sp. STM 4661]|nr:hypothetical protein MESS4_750161 [Mesorhizobium sp. STM 4661]
MNVRREDHVSQRCGRLSIDRDGRVATQYLARNLSLRTLNAARRKLLCPIRHCKDARKRGGLL